MVQDQTAAMALHPSVKEVRFGPFRFDRVNRILMRGDEEISLPPRALGILEVMMEHRGEIVSKQELMDVVWKESHVSETSLTEAISFLRQSLGDNPQDPMLHPDRPPAGISICGGYEGGGDSCLEGDSRPGIVATFEPSPCLVGTRRWDWPHNGFLDGSFLPATGSRDRRDFRHDLRFRFPLSMTSLAYRQSLAISSDGRDLVFVARQESTVWLFRRSYGHDGDPTARGYGRRLRTLPIPRWTVGRILCGWSLEAGGHHRRTRFRNL